jgi:two-component system, NtrC family, sensor kinase
MKKIFSLVLFFLLLNTVTAQMPKQAVAVGKASPKNVTLQDSSFKYLETGSKKLTLKQVLANGDTPLPEEEERFLPSKLYDQESWMWYRLKNTTADDYIAALHTKADIAHIYVYDAGKWHHYKTGSDLPWSKKDGDKNKGYIPYTVKAGREIAVYINENNAYSDPKIGNFVKITRDAYLTETVFSAEQVITFGFAGFILFGMIFNMLFYYVSREKLYLFYSLLLFFSALSIANEAIDVLYFRENADLKMYFQVFTGIGFSIMFVYTVRYFFNMKSYFPRWDKVLAYYPPIYMGLSVLLALLFYIFKGNDTFIEAIVIVGLFWVFASFGAGILFCGFMVLLICMLVILAKRKDSEARLFTLALLPFFASFVIALFLPWDWITLTASVWAIIVLSWGMFARFKRLQEEYAAQALDKERIAREKEEEKNVIIAQQNIRLEQLVAERTADLEASLDSLKQTQDQLIQSEKMASLGELTAGIAHEIQNPLNFVNNFSDVSIELLEEMEEELDKGDTDEVKAIAGDIKQNLEKIAHHGRRADGIVKGMLQHSRASSGQKEPVDINALADEYFRLAYHGLRAKDKSFNADLVTYFAEGLPKVNIIPQDMGRVLLNLFTNAFYATQEKGKQYSVVSDQSQLAGYKPAVTVSTKQLGNTVEITVKDNGIGIPDTIKDKILQPFFTTKPTGEGTGLGLSLSYDIIVKGHGGTIDIVSKEGEGAEFIIILPV